MTDANPPTSSPATMPQPPTRVPPDPRVRARKLALFAWLLWPTAWLAIIASFTIAGDATSAFGVAALSFSILLLLMFVLAVIAIVYARRAGSNGATVAAVLATIAAPATWLLAAMGVLAVMAVGFGGAWGRPLRIRGRQLHPNLRSGSDWTRGKRPNAAGVDDATRRALEALWLHDAQKEHASVPAFSRISWMLAAVGAPAELMEWSHQAALEEIEHTRLCFALAAGYGERSHTVEPMPDLLIGALEVKNDPISTLAKESLSDGCQLEDFNADVAAACAVVCEEPITRAVLEQIAREERSHAEFSWALLRWLVDAHADRALPAIDAALAELSRYPRPTAVSLDKRALVERANVDDLRRHGRLPDERWREIWDARLLSTRARVLTLSRRAA